MTPLEIIFAQISDPFRIGLITGAVLLVIMLHGKHIPPALMILFLVVADIALAVLIPATMPPHGPVTFWPRALWGILSNALLILIIGTICSYVMRLLQSSE